MLHYLCCCVASAGLLAVAALDVASRAVASLCAVYVGVASFAADLRVRGAPAEGAPQP